MNENSIARDRQIVPATDGIEIPDHNPVRRVGRRVMAATISHSPASAARPSRGPLAPWTADIAKIMMLGVGPLLARLGARLVLQIHDELVFEVPHDRVVTFIREAMITLSRPPCPGFTVPIVLEPKHGTRFGALEWWEALAIASLRPPPVRRGPAWSPPSSLLVACGVPYIKRARARVRVARRVRCSPSTGSL